MSGATAPARRVSSGLAREASQRPDHDLALAGLPHLGHRRAQIAAVASCDQAGVEDGHNAAIAEAPDQPTGALGGSNAACVAATARKPLPPASATARWRARMWLVRSRKGDRRSPANRWRPARRRPARATESEQTHDLVLNEPSGEFGQLGVALAGIVSFGSLFADMGGGGGGPT